MKLWGDGKISNAQYCYTYLLINSIQKSLITQVCNFPLRVKEPARSEKAPKKEGKLDILRPGDFFIIGLQPSQSQARLEFKIAEKST